MDIMSTACQIVQVSHGKRVAVEYVAELYFKIGTKLHLRYLRSQANQIKIDTYWDKLSVKSFIDHSFDQQMRLTEEIVKYRSKLKKDYTIREILDKWVSDNEKQISRFNELIYDIQAQDNPDFSMLNVAGNRITEVTSVK